MSTNPQVPNVDRSGMAETGTVSRRDEFVMNQFRWEVGQTLDLVRSVTMAGSHIDGVTVDEIVATCIENLTDLGSALELVEFLACVDRLGDVAKFDRADGATLDRLINEVEAEASR